MKKIDHIINTVLQTITEQEAKSDARVTANAKSDADTSPFTPAEEKFLGKFDAYGTTHLGVIYSPTDIGIRELIARSGNDLNITPGILLNLIRNQVIKIVPYTGFGRNTDYTIELQLSLDDVKGLGKEDKEKIEAGGGEGGGATAAAEESPMPEMPSEPAPEVAGYIPTGKLIKEISNVTSKINLNEHADLLIEAIRSLNEIDESPEKKYLQSKYLTMDKSLQTAFNFWKLIDTSLSEFDWDENRFFNAFKVYITNQSNAVRQVLITDAIRTIMYMTVQASQQKSAPATRFMKDWFSKEWSNLVDLDSEFKSIQQILQDPDVAEYIFSENQPETFVSGKDAEGNDISKTMTWKLQSDLNSKGIGMLVPSDSDASKGISTVKQYKFFPTYTSADSMAWVLKLLAPYQSDAVTKGGAITKTKPVTFADTLSKEEKIKRGKAAKDQIKKNIDTFIVNMPDGQSKENVRKIVDSYNAWIDPKGYGYVYAATTQGNQITRLYPDSKWAVVDKKTGKVIKSGKTWYWEWSSTDKKWNLVISSK